MSLPVATTNCDLEAQKPEIIRLAQEQYDAWDASGEEGDLEVGFGGICHLIAEEIAGHLNGAGFDAETVSSTFEQHVSVVVCTSTGIYSVDIRPGWYETGAGYQWEKIPGVIFEPGMVDIHLIDANPENFRQYTDEG
jgi:hypothetical protein